MTKSLALFSTLMAGALTGCIQVEQTLTLNSDGSGRLDVRYGMSQAALEEMQTMAAEQMREQGEDVEIRPSLPFDFDEEQIRKDFEEYEPHGVKLDSIDSEDSGGWKYVNLGLLFQTLEGLGKTEFIADRSMVLQRNAEGNYVLQQGAARGVEEMPEMDEAVTQMMSEMMKGFRAVVRVTTPGPILDSNADTVEGQTATWEFDLAKDAKALERVQNLDLRVVFDGSGLSLPEYGNAGPDDEEK